MQTVTDYMVIKDGSFILEGGEEQIFHFELPSDVVQGIKFAKPLLAYKAMPVTAEGSVEMNVNNHDIVNVTLSEGEIRGLWEAFSGMFITPGNINTIGIRVTGNGIRFADIVLWYQRKISPFSVTSFGASPENPDNSSAIQEALDTAAEQGINEVLVPAGSYSCYSQINIPSGMTLMGHGTAATELSFQNAAADRFPANGCVVSEGSLDALPDLGADLSRNDTTVTFANNPGLSSDDVFVIRDSTDFSFNMARNQYVAGEWMKAAVISESAVTVDRPVFDTYSQTNANISLHRLNPTRNVSIKNMKITGIVDTDDVAAIRFILTRDALLENLLLTGSRYACAVIERSYDVVATKVNCFDVQEDAVPNALNYGIQIANSQRILISDCQMTTGRHCISLGGNTVGNGAVPQREIRISHCILTALRIAALDAHGDSEAYTFSDCTLNGGLSLGGDDGRVSNCRITSSGDISGRCVVFTEMKGVDFHLANCEFIETKDPGGSVPSLVQMDILPPDQLTREGGVMRFHSCNWRCSTGQRPLLLRNRNGGTNDINVEIIGCGMSRSTSDGEINSSWNISGDYGSKSYWRRIILKDNYLMGGGITIDSHGAEEVVLHNNIIIRAQNQGIECINSGVRNAFPHHGEASARQTYDIKENRVELSLNGGIRIQGWEASISRASIKGNFTVDNVVTNDPPGAEFRTSIFAQDLGFCDCTGNTIGYDHPNSNQDRLTAFNNINTLVDGDNAVLGSWVSFVLVPPISRRISRWADNNAGVHLVRYDSSEPSEGIWQRGDMTINSEPQLNQPILWMCTESGVPGSWVAGPLL